MDVKTQTTTRVDPRAPLREARRLRLISSTTAGGKPATVKVWPGDEALRQVLRHPKGIGFRAALDQPVEWPADSFTTRRVADGSVRTDGPAPTPHHPELLTDPSLNPRQQAAVRTGARAIAEHAKGKLRLTSLSPNTAVAGSAADIVMSCIGTGFTKETVIKFGDYDEPTTFVSATEVTTGVKPSLFINPDTVPVLVHTGEIASDPLPFTFTAAATQAAAKPSHATAKHA